MSEQVIYQDAIPSAPFYVVTEDSFMSGWGMAQGKTNVLVFPCASYSEARIVADNARARSDQKRVRINATKPRRRSHWLLQVKDRDDYGSWYEPGYFARQRP